MYNILPTSFIRLSIISFLFICTILFWSLHFVFFFFFYLNYTLHAVRYFCSTLNAYNPLVPYSLRADTRSAPTSFYFYFTRYSILYTQYCFYSHSIVAGGFELISYTTRLIPLTSLIILLDISSNTLYDILTQSAVIPSLLFTILKARTKS